MTVINSFYKTYHVFVPRSTEFECHEFECLKKPFVILTSVDCAMTRSFWEKKQLLNFLRNYVLAPKKYLYRTYEI